jgi:hypothetical protein
MMRLRGSGAPAALERRGRQHGHGRLAHGQHVQLLGPDVPHELAHVAHVVVEAEAALGDRHEPRVDPVGDVDGVVGQQRAHRLAQQRRVVPGKGRHHQHGRVLAETRDHVRLVAVAPEPLQAAEGLGQRRLLEHGDARAAHLDFLDAEERLLVPLGQPVEELVPGRGARGARHPREPAPGRGEHPDRGLRPLCGGSDESALVLVEVIQQDRYCRCLVEENDGEGPV